MLSGALSYNLLVAPMTQRATGVDLGSDAQVHEQVDLLMRLLSVKSAA